MGPYTGYTRTSGYQSSTSREVQIWISRGSGSTRGSVKSPWPPERRRTCTRVRRHRMPRPSPFSLPHSIKPRHSSGSRHPAQLASCQGGRRRRRRRRSHTDKHASTRVPVATSTPPSPTPPKPQSSVPTTGRTIINTTPRCLIVPFSSGLTHACHSAEALCHRINHTPQ